MQRKPHPPLIRILISFFFTLAVTAIMVIPIYQNGSSEQKGIGEVSSEDIHAPYTLTYISDILTENAKDIAVAGVEQVFYPVDPSIARQQIERLQTILNYINLVRNDNFASTDQKVQDVLVVPEIIFTNDEIVILLSLPTADWQLLQQESVIVLEQVMRNTIREGTTQDAISQVPRLISFKLNEDLASLVTKLVTPLIAANSLYNEEATESAFQTARDNVPDVTTTYVAGQTIVNSGEVISPLVWEALSSYSLLQTSDTTRDIIAAVLVSLVSSISLLAFLNALEDTQVNTTLGYFLVLAFFLVYLIIARITIPGHTVLPYFFPLAGFGLVLSGIYSVNIALVSTVIVSILAAYNLPIDLELTVFYMITTFVGLYSIGNGRRISSFLSAGFFIGIAGTGLIVGYRLPNPSSDWIGIITLIFAAFFNGIASGSLALLLRLFFGRALGIITPLELLDLSRPDHPLLQELMRIAPGTYQHSLQVANLAEQAAEAIGADALLTRVGALFHDIGKMATPHYFIENQIPGQDNPHDQISPLNSSKVIQNHVVEGVELAKEFHLPKQIQNFILEHHGTTITRYQYVKAVQEAGYPSQVAKEEFQYPGPAPMSRETAIVMMADGCEARFRAELPQDEDSLRDLIKSQFEHARKAEQLRFTHLSLIDIEIIQDTFVRTLKNMQHLRIKYPKLEETTGAASE